MNAPTGPDASPHSIIDRLFAIYRDHVPARNKERLFAVLDDPHVPSATPADPRDPNPDPQWLMGVLDKLDALIDPYHPLPDEPRKARNAIRRACMDQLSRAMRERFRQQARELPL